MNARDVLAGLKAAAANGTPRWHGGPVLCPVCGWYPRPIEGDCHNEDACALAAAIQWFEDHVGAEDIRAKTDASLAPVTKALDESVANAKRLLADHCDGTLCKQWGDASGNCNCPCTSCVDADGAGRHRTIL